MNILILWLTKAILFFSQTLKLGAGSTWPGHIALMINSNFIKQIMASNKKVKVVLIAGTNGKTTTTTLLRHILEKNGYRVFQNNSGANLLNGIASSIIRSSSVLGSLAYDVALFETDENTFPLIVKEINPFSIVFLNLFRDQLDRYGEVNTIAKHWKITVADLPKSTLLFVNGDDPELTFIGEESNLDVHYFGLSEEEMKKKEIPHDVDFLYCPHCQTKLEFKKMSYSHMGIFHCPKCNFGRKAIESISEIPYPLFGTYNKYNTNAAALVAYQAFGINTENIKISLSDFRAAFGRQEQLIYKGKRVVILLSKNPAGFNQSIDAVSTVPGKHTALLALNDRIPDGRDVSWIWDVDFEDLDVEHLTVSGDRTYDMALRVHYAEKKFDVEDNLEKAIHNSLNNTKDDQTLFILATYSAMLETREIITGRKIL